MNQRISSSSAFILAIAGAAIGLGNIWRFPYVAGEHGGSLFFLIYLLFVILMGLPVMVAEIALGRAGRGAPDRSFRQLALANDRSRHWSVIAWPGTLAATLILSFYSVVSGWVIFYGVKTVQGGLTTMTIPGAEQLFNSLLASPQQLLLYHSIFIALTVLVSAFQISRGIEKLNAWLMPLMYLILLGLVLYVSRFSGFAQALDYLFSIRIEALDGRVLLEAMGHAFFTLAIGACCLMAYGAYMPENQSIIKAVAIVALLDVLVAVMVGIASFSVVFTENMTPAGGPGLMFVALPVALANMPLGQWVLPLFFLLMVIATWTSSVNLGEPLVLWLSRRLGSRVWGALAAGVLVWLLGIIPLLSFNLLADLRPLGKSLFDLYTAIPTQLLLPVTGALILLFSGYVINQQILLKQLALQGGMLKCWLLLIRVISPALVLTVLVAGILQFFL